MSGTRVDCLTRRDGERTLLLAPLVGSYTRGPQAGRILQAGEECGTLLVLGRPTSLLVPAGVHGRVVGGRPERVLQPVGFGELLVELAPLAERAAPAAPVPDDAASEAQLVVRAPSAGRYWLRPAPGEAPFVELGQRLDAGSALGLIEVMKTFTRLAYRPGAGLPERARVLRILVADGAEVAAGAPLLELEPA